jgi:hypothetical protein
MKTIKSLYCACCDREARGRQFFNQDRGYGLCKRCADRIEKCEGLEYVESCYGKKGIHHSIKGEVEA